MFSIRMGIEESSNESFKVNYRNAVRAVIIKGNNILMVHTNKGDYKFPGGGLEENENYKEALTREVQEETGYIISRIKENIGIVIQRKEDIFEKNTIFEMESTYYLCEVLDEKKEQKLDDYELEQEFIPVWIEINKAIETNTSLLNEKDKNPWVEREILVLRELLYLREEIQLEKVIIRKAAITDAKELIEYLNIIGGETDFLTFGVGQFGRDIAWEEEFIANALNKKNSLFIIAQVKDKIVGNLNFTGGQRKRTEHVGEFGVSVLKEYWGNGIGEELIKYLINWSKESGIIRKINLRVRTDNKGAISLYKKLGFSEEGLLKRDFLINNEFYDSILMGSSIN